MHRSRLERDRDAALAARKKGGSPQMPPKVPAPSPLPVSGCSRCCLAPMSHETRCFGTERAWGSGGAASSAGGLASLPLHKSALQRAKEAAAQDPGAPRPPCPVQAHAARPCCATCISGPSRISAFAAGKHLL